MRSIQSTGVIVLACLALALPAVVRADVVTGLVGHWDLDETTGTAVDNQVSATDGAISGSVALNQPGALAQGAAFTFSGGIVDTEVNPVPATGDFSIFAWIKTTQTSTATIFGSHFGQTNRYNVFMTASGELSWFHNGGVGIVATGFDANDGEWHLIGVTRDANAFTFWFDGESVSLGSSTTALSTARNFILGGRLQSPGFTEVTEAFSGSIDDVRIYSRALSSGDVAELRAMAVPTPAALPAGLVCLGLAAVRRRR